MFLPAACDVAVSYFVDSLCVCVDLLRILACVEVVVIVSAQILYLREIGSEDGRWMQLAQDRV
jgi:hypothetical protein